MISEWKFNPCQGKVSFERTESVTEALGGGSCVSGAQRSWNRNKLSKSRCVKSKQFLGSRSSSAGIFTRKKIFRSTTLRKCVGNTGKSVKTIFRGFLILFLNAGTPHYRIATKRDKRKLKQWSHYGVIPRACARQWSHASCEWNDDSQSITATLCTSLQMSLRATCWN